MKRKKRLGEKVIKQVSKDFGLTVTDAVIVKNLDKKLGVPYDWFDEASYICGKEVTLGRYKDDSVRLASFFHEVGHIIGPQVNTEGIVRHTKKGVVGLGKYKFLIEKDAWDKGIALAKKYDVVFSQAAMDFMEQCLDKALQYQG